MPKGVKICSNPECKKEIRGARTLICPACKTKVGVSLEEKATPIRKIVRFPDGYDIPDGVSLTIVHTPAGRCPKPCQASSEDNVISLDDILEWASNVRQYMITTNKWYFTNNALAYWARQMNLPQSCIGQLKYLPDYVVTQKEGEAPND